MKPETIAPASIQYFPLAQLYVSDLNPRQDADPEGIDLLADSLAMIGLIQNLSGILDAEGRVGIVAGGRRLRAIARAVERGEIRAKAVTEDLWDVLPGYLIYRTVLTGRSPSRRTVSDLVDNVLIPGLTRHNPR